MSEPSPISSSRRLKELLAISETERTEAQWDEINELEISLTPVNRKLASEKSVRQKAVVPVGHPKPRSSAWSKKPPSKYHQRPEGR